MSKKIFTTYRPGETATLFLTWDEMQAETDMIAMGSVHMLALNPKDAQEYLAGSLYLLRT